MTEDPGHAGVTPQPEQQQEPPGYTAEMTPKPDHGEESYRRLWQARGRAAIITGGGIRHRPRRRSSPAKVPMS